MLERNNHLWCIVGASGSGKSSVCRALHEGGGFTAIERDRILEEICGELGGFERSMYLLDHGKRNERRAVLRELRKKLRELIHFLSDTNTNAYIEEDAMLQNLLSNLRYLKDRADEEICKHPNRDTLLFILLGSLARQRAVREAIRLCLEDRGNVLLDDAGLLEQGEFLMIRKLLQAHGIEPGVVIVRTFRERLAEVALARSALADQKRLTRERVEISARDRDMTVSYPDISKVIVHDNVGHLEESVATIRHRILEGDFDKTVKWPLKLSFD